MDSGSQAGMTLSYNMLFPIIIATLAVSMISFIGILAFSKTLEHKVWTRRLIGLATGTLLGAVFFDLLPEAMEAFEEPHTAALIIFMSILVFFVIEKAIHYHHCNCHEHEKSQRKAHLVYTNLIGDGIHNFVDGTIIAGAFLVNPGLGIATTIAVALHEIPQEVSDFSILVYGGLTRVKAILYNVLFGLTSVIGGIAVVFIANAVSEIIPILLAIATGNFIYLAMSDLIPELHQEENPQRIWTQVIWIALGIGIMYGIGFFAGHE